MKAKAKVKAAAKSKTVPNYNLGKISVIFAVIGFGGIFLSSIFEPLAWLGWAELIALALGVVSLMKEKNKLGIVPIAVFILLLPTVYYLPMFNWYGAWLKCGGNYPIEAYDPSSLFGVPNARSSQYYTHYQVDYVLPLQTTTQSSIFGSNTPDAYFCSDSAAQKAGFNATNNQDGGHYSAAQFKAHLKD
jgi:hypothetical protein